MDRKLGTVPFKVRNFKFLKDFKFQKDFKFFFKLADCNGDFWPNLNQVIYYLIVLCAVETRF